jgi:hypothetical protein
MLEPILHAGWPWNIFRKIDEVFRATIPDIEEGLLPGPDRLQSGEFVEVAPLAGRENATPAPDKRFGVRKVRVLDGVLPQIVEKGKIIYRRGHTDVPLHESGEGRKIEDGVARKVMGMKLIEIEKAPEEIRRRKA